MKITILAPQYYRENFRLQPWRYLYEITKHFIRFKCEVTVITDGYPKFQRSEIVDNVPVIHLRHVKHFPPINFDDIIKAITETDPDAILLLAGLTSFFQKDLYRRLKCDAIALVSSPVYSLSEFLASIGPAEGFRNRKILMANFAETIVPRCLIRNTLNMDVIKYVVTMSERNRQRLESIGVETNKLIRIPPGTDSSFLDMPPLESVEKARNEICSDLVNCFLITYFGPPLTIRGLDTLLSAVELMQKQSPLSFDLRVLILSREQSQGSQAHLNQLVKLTDRFNLQKVIKIYPHSLSRNEIKTYIAASDLVALPFKIVVSDVPLSIMEGMCLGKPVLSTDLDGIPELLDDDRGIVIEPGDYRQLADIIMHYATKKEEIAKYGKRAREYMINHLTWQDTALKMLSLVKKVTNG